MDRESKIGLGAATAAVAVLGILGIRAHLEDQPIPPQPIADPTNKNVTPTPEIRSLTNEQAKRELYQLLGYPDPNTSFRYLTEEDKTINSLQALSNFFQGLEEYRDHPTIKFDGKTVRFPVAPVYPAIVTVQTPNDGVYAHALAEAIIRDNYFHQEDRSFYKFRYTGKEAIPDILALQKRLTFIDKEQTYSVQPQVLAQLNRTFQTMEQQGKRTPHKALVSSKLDVAADEDTIIVTDLANRSLARYYASWDPVLFDRYRQLFRGQDNEPAIRDRLARLLSEFLDNGTFLRNQIRYRQTGKPGYYGFDFNWAEYNLVRDWLGVDISRYGIPIEVRDFTPGEMAGIQDAEQRMNGNYFGIFLREKPEPGLDPNRPHIADRWAVKVLGEPKMVLFPDQREATEMYRVQAGWTQSIVNEKGEKVTAWVPFYPSQEGWIRSDFMTRYIPELHNQGFDFWSGGK